MALRQNVMRVIKKECGTKSSDDLKQQVSAKLAELDNEKNEKTAKDDRLKALEQTKWR